MKRYAIIVAGGKGLRMGSEVPKQFLLIKDKPVLLRTLQAFHSFDSKIQIIVVLPAEQQETWQQICVRHECNIPHQITTGGETRFHSVKNGLALIPDNTDAVVGVHDGVRPFVSQEVLQRCYALAEEYKAVIPVVPVIETIRKLNDAEGSKSVPRSDYRLVQTPQVFEVATLKQAYQQPYIDPFTDDASVVEAMGIPVALAEGNRENIKITTQFDLRIAEALT